MTISKIRTDLIQSEEFADFIKGLQEMQDSPRYNTQPCYTPQEPDHPDCTMSFIEKHTQYAIEHPNTELGHYLSNLKLMTRK